MTDAERIAEYLTAVSASGEEWTLADVQRNAGLRGGRSSLLLAILSNVRSEEREACLADIAAERAVWHSGPTRKALDYAANRINGRGTK